MWQDNNDKILDILDIIETNNKECFPVVCPICRRRDGHLYFHRYMEGDERGGMWTWCSACYHSAHTMYRLLKWWKNLDEVHFERLTNYPNYLEDNKISIDEWVNKLMCLNFIYEK